MRPAVSLLAIGVATALLFGAQASARVADSARACRVSSVGGHPISGRPSFNYGNAGISVSFPDQATFAAIPDHSPGGANAFLQKDGWIRTKLGWYAAPGTPRVTGRRLDRPSRPLRADVGPLSRSSSGSFYPSLLYFSSLGCWKITATAGGARLDAIVRVVRK